MNVCLADLHVHTALSPCAESDMTPLDIAAWAVDEGLHMIAICDHNSCRNAAAVQEAAGHHLRVLAGIEITTLEECHVVGLFPDAERAGKVGAEVTATLPPADQEYTRFFGEQLVLGPIGESRGQETHALAMASGFDVAAAVRLIHAHDGIAVAAHVDRKTFGVVSQLGFFPHEAGFDAVEVSKHVAPGSEADAEAASYGLPVVRSSDAHYLRDIGAARTALRVTQPAFEELVSALRGEHGRSVSCA